MSEQPQEQRVSATFPDLARKVAIVTGASRGIGAGIGRFLGLQGMKVVLTARSQERGEALVAELAGLGIECEWVTGDCSIPEDAQRVFDAAIDRFGQIDLLVNNAASLKSIGVLDLDEDAYRMTFETNARLVYQLSYLVARYLVDRGAGGNIINITSVGGLRAHQQSMGYDASKGAMDAMTRSMAIDLAQYGIRVNSVAPGATASRGEEFWNTPKRKAHRKAKEALIPLGRFGHVDDMAAAVAFLASDAAAYITGQILYVDGGITTQLSPPGIRI